MTESQKTNRFLSILVAMLCIIAIVCAAIGPVYAVPELMNQGTNGDELNIVSAQKLEIQLGTEWSDKKFQLKTDAGLYPGDIIVDNDGILRFEIGGSTSYILSCVGLSEVSSDKSSSSNQEPAEGNAETDAGQEDMQKSVSGIPIKDIIIFAVVILVAIGLLVALRSMRQSQDNDNEDEK